MWLTVLSVVLLVIWLILSIHYIRAREYTNSLLCFVCMFLTAIMFKLMQVVNLLRLMV